MRRFLACTLWLGTVALGASARAQPVSPDPAPPAPSPGPSGPAAAPIEPDPSAGPPPSDGMPPSPEPGPAEETPGAAEGPGEAPEGVGSDAVEADSMPPSGDEPEDLPPVIPDAADARGGHVAIGGYAGLSLPFGTVERDVSLGDSTSIGPSFGLDVGVGVSRSVMIGAYGSFALPGGAGPCADCSPQSIALGLFVRYHLAQGLAFDPWMQAGAGVRLISFDDDLPSYTAVDFARLRLGGDWYPWAIFGFGPVLEFALGTPLAKSEGSFDDSGVIAEFAFGLRGVLDFPGK